MEREITEFEKNLHWVYTPMHRDDMHQTPTIAERKDMLRKYATEKLQGEIETYHALISHLAFAKHEILQTADTLSLDTVFEDLSKLANVFEDTRKNISDIEYTHKYAQTIQSRAQRIYD